MQPQTPPPAPRPVMDVSVPPRPPVAPAPAVTPLPSVPVKQAPVDVAAPPVKLAPDTPPAPLPKFEDKPDEKAQSSQSAPHKVAHNTPTGLIVATLLVMAGLSGLTILIYLNS